MDTTRIAELLRTHFVTGSRRGALAGLTGGLLALSPLARGSHDAVAKKHGRRKQKRKTKNKKKATPAPPSPPPPVPPPGPSTRADASCAGPEIFSFGIDENERLAQTFTALASGPLVRADLRIRKDAETFGDVILQVGTVDAFGIPTNEVLAFTSVASASVPTEASTVMFTFANPATVTAGTQYALVLSRQGPDFVSWFARNDDPCGGQVFFSPDQTAPFESETFGNRSDVIFTTFVTS